MIIVAWPQQNFETESVALDLIYDLTDETFVCNVCMRVFVAASYFKHGIDLLYYIAYSMLSRGMQKCKFRCIYTGPCLGWGHKFETHTQAYFSKIYALNFFRGSRPWKTLWSHNSTVRSTMYEITRM